MLAFLPHNALVMEAAAEPEQEAETPPAPEPKAKRAKEPTEEDLAARYEEIFDKPPHPRMKPETIAARIAEHDDAK